MKSVLGNVSPQSDAASDYTARDKSYLYKLPMRCVIYMLRISVAILCVHRWKVYK
jgi:hypothetical protein